MNLEKNYMMTEKSENEGGDFETFFFDTYALYRVYEGSEAYKKYEGCKIVLTKLNLFEIYLVILRNYGDKDAEEFFDNYCNFARDFDENVIKEAAKMKKELNKRDLSMADCIGYAMAKQFGIKFLTGDEQFKDLENVKYVK